MSRKLTAQERFNRVMGEVMKRVGDCCWLTDPATVKHIRPKLPIGLIRRANEAYFDLQEELEGKKCAS